MLTIHEKIQNLLNAKDKDGNVLRLGADDSRVYLTIDDEERCLGHVVPGKSNILYTKFDDESNIFQKTNAWSINYTIFSVVDHIHIETRTYDYQITKERAEEFGEFFHFKNTTELKIYIPLKYWDKRHRGLAAINPKEARRRNLVGDSWFNQLQTVLYSPLVEELSKTVAMRRNTKGVTVFPESDQVFRALHLSSFEHTKVIILGQDPYNDGSADGLAFSFNQGERYKEDVMKSLDVILQEVERDLYNGMKIEFSYNLAHWARQGVLLLNTILTVEKGKALTHENIGWERVTKIILKLLTVDPSPKVFVLWGAKAKDHFADVLNKVYGDGTATQMYSRSLHRFNFGPHLVLTAKHPASDLYNRDELGRIKIEYPATFSGCRHFSQINEFLSANNRKPIKW